MNYLSKFSYLHKKCDNRIVHIANMATPVNNERNKIK